MSSLWNVDTEEGSSSTKSNTVESNPLNNPNQSTMLRDLIGRLDQMEAALKTSEARVEQVEACRKVSDAKVELLESKLRTYEAKVEENSIKLKASEDQLGQFKTYLKASDEKVKQLEKSLAKTNFEVKDQHKTTLIKTKDNIDIILEEKEKMQQEITNFTSKFNKVESQLTKKIGEIKANEIGMRKQMRESCIEMEQTRKKMITLSFNQPLSADQQKKVNNDLWLAASQGDIKQIRDALDNGADINCKLNKGVIGNLHHDNCPPLLAASSYGNAFAVEYLLLRGSDLTETNILNASALHFASLRGHDEVISLLIEYGVSVNHANKNNWTPLHLASCHGNSSAMRLLLERGAETTARNDRFFTPIQEAGLENQSKKDAVLNVFQEFMGE